MKTTDDPFFMAIEDDRERVCVQALWPHRQLPFQQYWADENAKAVIREIEDLSAKARDFLAMLDAVEALNKRGGD